MQLPDDNEISRMTLKREEIKSNLKKHVMAYASKFSTEYTSSKSRSSWLRRLCIELTQYDQLSLTSITKAYWDPSLIKSTAIARGAPKDGLYEVIYLRQINPDCSMIIDPFCHMFLNWRWSYDMCFLDFYQVRLVSTARAPLTFISPVQASKKTVIEALLNDKNFLTAVRSAFESKAVTSLIKKNSIEKKPMMFFTCSEFVKCLKNAYDDVIRADQRYYRLEVITGRWNATCLATQCAKLFTSTQHDWLRILDSRSYETVEFDLTFGQFVDVVPDLDNLRIFFYDLGQMRSKGITQDERLELSENEYDKKK